ncbi:MAG: hypothetical protein ACREU7_15485 [Burkholderiales bacterium]
MAASGLSESTRTRYDATPVLIIIARDKRGCVHRSHIVNLDHIERMVPLDDARLEVR